ncbi:hypothetical protein CEXT_277041 [Caerostris extrusa]|uniref:Uncharacterized protein n=1 Tax=Caerostris extrusa TaxID=172846 RepID=A0AAV4XW96_CAEEX|nr:hypothetical protein CEXT_277041 [Caerostris extrusa]
MVSNIEIQTSPVCDGYTGNSKMRGLSSSGGASLIILAPLYETAHLTLHLSLSSLKGCPRNKNEALVP